MQFSQIFETIASKRILLINGRIGGEDQVLLCLGIKLCNVQSEVEPIALHIDSHGGDTTLSGYISDAIKFSKAPVHGIVTGQACSAAFRILLACDRRMMYPNARVMFHGPRTDYRIDRSDFSAFYKLNLEGMASFQRKLAKMSGKPLSRIKKWSREEYEFTAEEALELNFIDEILTPPQKRSLK